MKSLLTLCLTLIANFAIGQLLQWAPQFANENGSITITANGASGNAGLAGHTGDVYLHIGAITNKSTGSGDWKYVKSTWGSTTAPKAMAAGTNLWSYTIPDIRSFFGITASDEHVTHIAVLFRDAAGNKVLRNASGADMYVPVYAANYRGQVFTKPNLIPEFILKNEAVNPAVNDNVTISFSSSISGSMGLLHNTNSVSGSQTGTSYSATVKITEAGLQEFIASTYISTNNILLDTLRFYVSAPTQTAALPVGAQEGVNVNTNCNEATFVLFAPGKNKVNLIGNFTGNDWSAKTNNQMYRTPDGNYYWITVNNLNTTTQYMYQYLVDDNIYIADPYSELVLDPDNDRYISAETFPNMPAYPAHANVSGSKNGFISVLKLCEPKYDWRIKNFKRPAKEDLIIYELLVRDFHEKANYQVLIDSIDYFKRLGVNAIELMPVNEFTGNDSWGYNPKFYCALDKAYGTKNKLKEFIDLCHENGIAVILDVVFNQMDAFGTPQGKMYWNNGKPAANSPWFNVAATHNYSVFEDLNHTKDATKYLVKRSLEYWVKEYNFDGYRFDLAKGFTQKCTNGVNETCPVSSGSTEDYDAQRVSILKDYYDYIIGKYPETYVILEFLGSQNYNNPNSEEAVYADYGFLLWNNLNHTYNQATMGFASNSNFSKMVYNSVEQSFKKNAGIGYMESHDEERLMYKNLQYGNSSGSYNVKNETTALNRQAAAATVFFTIPGPKMFWQFGERGYKLSLVYNGSNVAKKPPMWNEFAQTANKNIYDVYGKLINFRLANTSFFSKGKFLYNFNDNGGLVKTLSIQDTTENDLQMVVVANFDVTSQTRTIQFTKAGTWFQYVSNGTGSNANGATATNFTVTNLSQSITLAPGEYHVMLSHNPNTYIFMGSGLWSDVKNWSMGKVPPDNLSSNEKIIISPTYNGKCVVDKPVNVSEGARIYIAPNQKLEIKNN
ncbi:alpha-amylase family glycosyl hydrolase [Polluticaenibacter yanchengensis]|uniref:Alpha-amylase family glycosyl hydrolase n=1 Tax=Polluticaenibacter yanchengensis TaxID=3014562 RepID=A0ABT4ULV1_9BACT|nr:alpha-amylase family glycosyl hydrolase [Chitinophagaceae bacterium LY-5]